MCVFIRHEAGPRTLHDCYRENMSRNLSTAETLPSEPVANKPAEGQTIAALTRILVRALRALGERGEPENASRLAAQAWVAVRGGHHAEAERFAGVLHHLSRLHPSECKEPAEEKSMTGPDRLLDVRAEAPARRHVLIFETYTALGPGTGFVLVNDHDPKPLYYQFAAEHDGEFTWDYLEQGPEVWCVRIGRSEAGV